ncbi:MAG: hypothetical protein QMD13_06445 [Candidatus Bathyarchaeia archaeon]|nr:hypothetical protein [Candidatus Bathyarchaeia archaeon]
MDGAYVRVVKGMGEKAEHYSNFMRKYFKEAEAFLTNLHTKRSFQIERGQFIVSMSSFVLSQEKHNNSQNKSSNYLQRIEPSQL